MLQNKIATGRQTLFATSVYAVLALVAMGVIAKGWWYQSALLAVATALMVMLNNRNALIRVYSRMVSSSFLVLCIASSFLIPSISGAIEQILFIAAFHILFTGYQKKSAPRSFFYSFLCLGIISLQTIQISFLLPVIWLSAFTSLQASSTRNFSASMLGFLSPYWVWFPYSLWTDNGESIVKHISTITEFQPIASGMLEPHLLATTLLLTITGLIGSIHYLNHSYEDNIKTRMFYQTFISVFYVALVFMILQPQHSNLLLRILIICVSPLIAQYFVFTKSRLSNIIFIISIITTLALTVYNSWTF